MPEPTDPVETGKTIRFLIAAAAVVVILCGWGGVLYLLRK